MKEGRWGRRQVGLQRVWRSLLCCCGRQDENLDMEALIVVPVSGSYSSLIQSLVIF